ncbi:hypothetical protein CLOM_g295 [Closterium sp. NIES-68]|nr:hypothetical protein CLOM_g295 [Closterium sp. NIES-68]GJP76434.1 hypothetical protein CLOP_g6883 [Closterium sp. NIES-67]
MASTVANRPRVLLPTSPIHRLSRSNPSNSYVDTPACPPFADDASAATPSAGAPNATPARFAQIDRRLAMWNRATAGAGATATARAGPCGVPPSPQAARRQSTGEVAAATPPPPRGGSLIPPIRSNSSPAIHLANSANHAATVYSPGAAPSSRASANSVAAVASQDRDAASSGASSPPFPASPSFTRSRSAHVNGCAAAVPGSPSCPRAPSRSLGEASAFSFGRTVSGGAAGGPFNTGTASSGVESVFQWAAKRRIANRIKAAAN